MVWDEVHEVGAQELDDEAGDDIAKEDDAFGDSRADKVEGSGQDDYVDDIIDET